MNKSVLIVEDEPLIADDISFFLQDMGITAIHISLDYHDAMEKLGGNSYDLILLDINLSSDKDGIDLANFISRSSKTPFIFLTSYYDTSTLERAKALNPAAYILKPFSKQDIMVNVELAINKTDSKPTTAPATQKFFIKDREGLISVMPEEIDFVEAFDNYARVYTSEKSFIISHTLKSIEEKLTGYGFDRIHKSYLINFSRITMISEGYVFFGEKKAPIGRAYKSEFMAKISTL